MKTFNPGKAIVSFRGTPTTVSLVDATDGTHLEPRCSGCQQPVDPTTCWCGGPVDGHGYEGGHSAVPMGCTCHRR